MELFGVGVRRRDDFRGFAEVGSSSALGSGGAEQCGAGRKQAATAVTGKLAAASAFIDQILNGDRQALLKQRHTARRIGQRLCAELPGLSVSERSVRAVRAYVSRRQKLVLIACEVYIPQSYDRSIIELASQYGRYGYRRITAL